MSYIFAIGLTTVIVSSIIVLAVKRGRKFFVKVVYTQSSIHQIIKNMIPPDLFDKPALMSQARKHMLENSAKVMIVEGQAYWVHNNMFFVAEMVDGMVDSDTVRPIDTSNMSKRDIDKMLFILDSLKDGNSDDSGSTWNK